MIFNHPYRYVAERVVRSFGTDFDFVFSEIRNGEFKVEARRGGRIAALSGECGGDEKTRLCAALYDALHALTGISPAWGIFTGVRPVKYIRESGRDDDYFTDKMKIRADKLALAREIAEVQKGVVNDIPENSFHLYVGIPFCPSRCGYCSFVSEAVGKSEHLIPRYVSLLIRELELIGDYSRKTGRRPDTVYIGGGTPTALPLNEQARVYEAVANSFDLSAVREYTVEAGRPDTLDASVLREIKLAGVDRVSINPQSMNDRVLGAIGRGHTARDAVKAYETARAASFAGINMDLIAGLPTEGADGFIGGLKRVIALKPDNITVHGLAFKKGSRLSRNAKPPFAEGLTGAAYAVLREYGYFPYYMYRLRESGTDGDNIGYSRSKDKIGMYNVFVMDENTSVLAAGCAGATRLAVNGDMRKCYNFKYPHEYISRFDELIENKFRLFGGITD
ncbi:MAG: coproporphyrinogen dehydrogenase HemZ [Oscillospiraceae bacterium]|jgi:oxygen-independent coproporphyrinogen-3 oxidase|nr:coproporphyrinogen dehydrogenase HemZ [Oscillospiraceae bacterium]